MGEKLIIVHADGLVGRSNPPAFARAGKAIASLMADAERAKKTVVRMSTEDQQLPLQAEVYVVGNNVTANITERVILPGDNVKIAGLYRDVCIAGVAEIAVNKGALPEIIEEATVLMDPTKWDA